MTLERLLNSVGKRTFVKYYYNFRDCSREYCISNFEEPFTEKAKSSRTSHAKAIFNNGGEKDALILISKSKKVEKSVSERATQILLNEF